VTGTTVHVIYEGVSATRLDADIARAGVESLQSIADIGNVEVVISGDLTRSVRSRLGAAEAKAFRSERVTGAVGAKVFKISDGHAIVMDARLLIPGAAVFADIDVPRLFLHEGLHIALASHGEGASAIVAPKRNTSGAHAHFFGQAAILVEEFRVERALGERGLPLHQTYSESLPGALGDANREFLDAVILRHPNEDVSRCYDASLRAFNALTVHMAYLSADDVVSAERGTSQHLDRGGLWPRLVGDFWDELRASLAPLPSADHRVGVVSLRQTAEATSRVLQRWLRHVGFDLDDRKEGLYFDVLRHDFG
jgi:hypothetical protein